MMKAGELFAGYGGLALAVEHVFEAQTAWVCEYDEAPAKILAHRRDTYAWRTRRGQGGGLDPTKKTRSQLNMATWLNALQAGIPLNQLRK